jgi:pimeloyl-ACP methyl ester carboxylesterase
VSGAHTVRTSDGVGLHVDDSGGEAPAVEHVAGFTAPATSWAPVNEALARAGYRTVAVDRRQHGDSEFPSHGQRIARHGQDLHEVITALELERPVLVGGSMGASCALALADLHGSAELGGLVTVDQTPRMVNDEDWQLGFTGLTWAILDGWVRAFPAGVPSPFVTPPTATEAAALAARPPYPIDQARGLLRDHAVQDWRDVVVHLQCPLLAIAGRQSAFWPWQHAEWMADNTQRGQSCIVDGAGHAVNRDQPDAVTAAVLGFLAGL